MIRIVLIAVCHLMAMMSFGQADDPAFVEGLKLEDTFQVQAALVKFETVLKRNPNHVQALIHASRMLSNIAGQPANHNIAQKRELLIRAQGYARQAIKLDENSCDARLAHIITLGLLSEIAASPKEKVADARLIHEEAVAILTRDSTYAEGYFVLGKWHLELAKLSWIELMACRIFFGGFPEEVSVKTALHYFSKALRYNPDSILFLFGQASAFYQTEEYERARTSLHRALSLPPIEPDDIIRKNQCTQLLQRINTGSPPSKYLEK